MTATVKQIQTISDEITMLMALTRAYRKSPVDIITATSKTQALEQIDIFTFQLILLDLDIGDNSAMDLLRCISSAQAGVPIILLTTGNSRAPELLEQIEICRPHGCWHILEKPFELNKLNKAIERGLLEHSFDGEAINCNLGDLRRCRRFKRSEAIKISLNGGSPPLFPATMNDISLTGLGLTTDSPLPVDQRVVFDEKFMHQAGVVIWNSVDTAGHHSGIRFI